MLRVLTRGSEALRIATEIGLYHFNKDWRLRYILIELSV